VTIEKIHVREALFAALMLTGAIEAAEDDEESERSNAAADRVSPESLNGARSALRCR
jgi:hypothetical protein